MSRATGRFGSAALAVAVAMFFSLGGAANENAVDRGAPPWSDLLVPSFARSVRIKNGEQAIMAEPNGAAFRRGTAALAARLPLFGARRGGGCRGAWLLVGPQAWLCDEHADYIADLPVDAAQPAVFARHDGLPYRYFFAGPGGSFAYRGLGEVDFGEPAMTLEAGFAVAVDHERIVGGERFGYTRRGLWVPMRDFGDAQPSDFRGEEIVETPPGLIPFGWVIADRSPYYRRVGASFVAAGRVGALLRRVDVLERSANLGGGAFLRIDGDTWMRERDVRRPTLAPPPDEEEIAHGARWLDIELATQTLVAYEGARPVFATLVSTGKGKKPGHPFETPKGVHRIWVKLVSTVMDNLENENAASYYRIEDVPYVQFFSKGVGLHAVFWHRRFGFERSHGCVNLAPHDAARLFHFTGPHVPAGWSAALPSRFDPGTIVRVR